MFKVNDIVTRISHNHDIVFKIVSIKGAVAFLSGVNYRLFADALMVDLVYATKNIIETEDNNFRSYKNVEVNRVKNKSKYLAGKILHIDSDNDFLKKCLKLYSDCQIYAQGACVLETDISSKILELMEKHNPDILVITGHDSYNNKGMTNINNYVNSKHFTEAINKVRLYHRQNVVIIAGACQSHFEALIASGADFATSPKRVNIHVYDPAIIAVIASITPFNEIISLDKILRYTYVKKGGLGGLETYGKLRLIL